MDLPAFDAHPILQANGRLLARLDGWESWLDDVRRATTDARAARAWLQQHRGLRPSEAELVGCLSHGEAWEFVDPARYASWAVERAEALFSGRKAACTPAFRRLVARARALGPDVRVCPLKTHVALLRGASVFAKVKPLASGALAVELAPDWKRSTALRAAWRSVA